jgi:hypothetical protein
MMAKDTSIPLLSEEARGVIWRIFGAGVSPLNGRATNELIEPVIRSASATTSRLGPSPRSTHGLSS